jgi:valyl-tRNA synthetase
MLKGAARGLMSILHAGEAYSEAARELEPLIGKLAGVSSVTITKSAGDVPKDALSKGLYGLTLYIAADDLYDYEAERERLTKEKERLEGNIKRLKGKLSNEGFTAKAPEQVVEAERSKLAAEEDAYEKTIARLAAIAGK